MHGIYIFIRLKKRRVLIFFVICDTMGYGLNKTKEVSDMREIIQKKLSEIEERENVKILYCAEAGSRATGLSSEDSDYDVRFIYVRPLVDYLKLEAIRDVIEWQCDGDMDISGWDIKKALALGYRSNPSLLEWMTSPTVYRQTEEWCSVAEIIKEFFSSKNVAMHYISMAKSNYDGGFFSESIKLKRYFYLLRPLLSAEWVFTKNEMPPLEFEKLTDLLPEGEIRGTVAKLVEDKRNGSKRNEGAPIPFLNEYITRRIGELEAKVRALPDVKRGEMRALDEVFLSLLKV